MEDYIIDIQTKKNFDVTKDELIRLTQVSLEYINGYMDALKLAYPHKFIFCNSVKNTKPYVMP